MPNPTLPMPPEETRLVPCEPTEADALARFTAYFVKNYPGPDTIIYKPEWHAPQLFRAAKAAMREAGLLVASPTILVRHETDLDALTEAVLELSRDHVADGGWSWNAARGFAKALMPRLGAVRHETAGAVDFLHQLRAANTARNAEYRAKTGGEPLPLLFRTTEFAGEVGELLNVVKKMERERLGWSGKRADRQALREEFGGVMATLDLLAMDLDIDLAAVTAAEFNSVTERLSLTTTISAAPTPPAAEGDAGAVEKRWIGGDASGLTGPWKVSRLERVAEIWRDQGLFVTEWVPAVALASRDADLARVTREAEEDAKEHAEEIEAARDEGYNEGLEEGRCEARGAHARVFHFIYHWLKDRGLIYDDGEGINDQDVADGLSTYKADGLAIERQATATAIKRAETAEQALTAKRARVAELEAALATARTTSEQAAEDERDRLFQLTKDAQAKRTADRTPEEQDARQAVEFLRALGAVYPDRRAALRAATTGQEAGR